MMIQRSAVSFCLVGVLVVCLAILSAPRTYADQVDQSPPKASEASLSGSCTLPGTVTLIAPSQLTSNATPTFTWDKVPGATWYYLWVNREDLVAFRQWYEVDDIDTGALCSVKLPDGLARGDYTWWIQAYNDCGYGSWSEGMDFYVDSDDGPPPPTTLISPSGVIPESPAFTWETVPDATWYYLWINDSAGTPVFQQWYRESEVECIDGQCSITPAYGFSRGSYTWWIQTWNDNGYGIWSGSMSFSVSISGENRAPVAESITLNVDSTVPYIEQQLVGSDPDGDTITYELVSESNGTGYSLAYVNAETGMLYITHEAAGGETFSLSYRVTDGLLFSDPATVTVNVTYLSDDEKDTGKNDVSPEDYADFDLSDYNSELLGDEETPTQPVSMDLSASFPLPGDQGSQSSCVGWATAYALKSYQEKVEIGWSLNTSSHLFSPAYVYNQINGGRDRGSYIYEALDLVVDQGAATLATMPYSDSDYLSQPSSEAFEEASMFKAASWRRVNDTSQIKAALVNRKPVVGGIKVYSSFYNLYGEDSVYNTTSGDYVGGHAITIVGYDDDRFDGAFRVINSWSTKWGDEGYFWMPYDFAAQGILSEAYVLEDAENGTVPDPEDPTEPEADDDTLPNLTVESWDATYNPKPRGFGSLTYSVVNNGSGVAYAGADINLMLSENENISTNDYYVMYEEIPFDLSSGESVYRDQTNVIYFRFPDQLEAGVYYMALWVDDLDEVAESNENDNVSRGDELIAFENSLPDLCVNTWYADWDGYGNGTLTYEVINSGAFATTTRTWDINLILDRDQTVGNGNEIYLFYENAWYYLEPGEYVYRDERNPGYFNLNWDAFGDPVPAGDYFMALWVDDLDEVGESNELNNGSYSWGTVSVSGYYGTDNDSGPSPEAYSATAAEDGEVVGKAYNGKKLPARNLSLRKVRISRNASGGISLEYLSEMTEAGKDEVSLLNRKRLKRMASKTGLIFPARNRMAMPDGGTLAGTK